MGIETDLQRKPRPLYHFGKETGQKIFQHDVPFDAAIERGDDEGEGEDEDDVLDGGVDGALPGADQRRPTARSQSVVGPPKKWRKGHVQ